MCLILDLVNIVKIFDWIDVSSHLGTNLDRKLSNDHTFKVKVMYYKT